MVAYLLFEYRETQATCGVMENSGADGPAKSAMLGRQNPVFLY